MINDAIFHVVHYRDDKLSHLYGDVPSDKQIVQEIYETTRNQ